MLSPMMTVFVLTVLWLIVVVPMLVRRSDLRRRERSVDGFGRAMRALGRSAQADRADARSEVFVPRERRAQAPAVAARRPVPAPQEALMYPVDRSQQLSPARAQMMRRRRRSLSFLFIGTALTWLLAFAVGGSTLWLCATGFVLGLGGYLYFLRTQALRDRERRANRQEHARTSRATGYDATDTEQIGRFDEAPVSVVRIDDDDIELQSMDTIDLTGLYAEGASEPTTQRRAS